jgi:hypothetical protein
MRYWVASIRLPAGAAQARVPAAAWARARIRRIEKPTLNLRPQPSERALLRARWFSDSRFSQVKIEQIAVVKSAANSLSPSFYPTSKLERNSLLNK